MLRPPVRLAIKRACTRTTINVPNMHTHMFQTAATEKPNVYKHFCASGAYLPFANRLQGWVTSSASLFFAGPGAFRFACGLYKASRFVALLQYMGLEPKIVHFRAHQLLFCSAAPRSIRGRSKIGARWPISYLDRYIDLSIVRCD